MEIEIRAVSNLPARGHLALTYHRTADLNENDFSSDELKYLRMYERKQPGQWHLLNRHPRLVFVRFVQATPYLNKNRELFRKAGGTLTELLNKAKIDSVTVADHTASKEHVLALVEGMALANIQFLKYFQDKDERANSLESIKVKGKALKTRLAEIHNVVLATDHARRLVNEPVSYLNAVQLGEEIKSLGKEAGFKVEVLNKSKIEALKMGGLLAVNQGSIDPPTFSILEWKPEKAVNSAPFVLVGKGIVYDTGGLSLKPTANSMDIMKCDMAGSAAVIGAIYAAAANELPIHVVGLIPATDNRPGGNAYAPGDVVKMHSGLNVEVLNTDAEGRMALADALSYAKKYNPDLVIDLATLTGSAARAIGRQAMVGMGTTRKQVMRNLQKSGHEVHERVVEFPFFEEYADDLKSMIADIKNLGGPEAGAITAGKFLEHFTDYPWIHLDIAGPAWLDKEDNYRGIGGSGVGVRLLYNFMKRRYL